MHTMGFNDAPWVCSTRTVLYGTFTLFGMYEAYGGVADLLCTGLAVV